MGNPDTTPLPELQPAPLPQERDDTRRASGRATLRASFRPALISIGVILLGIFSAYGVYAATHSDRVYKGVHVLGADIGGMNRDEARHALSSVLSGYPAGQVVLSNGDRTWTYSAAAAGVAADIDATIDAAMHVGRGGGLLDNAVTQIRVLFGGTTVTPVLKQDRATADKIIADISSQVDKRAVDSKLDHDESGRAIVTASSHGTVVDQVAARQALANSVAGVPFQPVSITMRDEAPAVTEEALQSSVDGARRVTEQPIVLKSGERSWSLDPADLRPMLTLSPVDTNHWNAALDEKALSAFLTPVAGKLSVEPQNASLTVGKNSATLTEDQSGQELDVPAAVAAIEKAAQQADESVRVVDLPLKQVEATVKTAQVKPLYDRVNTLLTEGIRLHYGDDGYILRGAAVASFVDVAPAQGGPGPLKLVVDQGALADNISGVAYYINKPPSDARFQMVNGKPMKVESATEGVKVDIAASTQKALQAIESYTGGDRLQIDLQAQVIEPAVKDADVAGIRTPDLLGYGETSYAGSSAERAWNVEFGAGKINGTLVPPGGIFSTNDTIGPLTLAAGFKMGYMIINDGGSLTTVPAEAGGICQVATTLFHAVFHSGMHVVERHWHSYWISLYGLPPSGMQGLDATIAPPDYDFRFQNNTGNWILIKTDAGNGKLAFNIYGVDPGWKINVSGPVITDVVQTNPTLIVQQSDKLPAGKEVIVEHAQNGFDATIHRVVTDSNGNVVDDWLAKSHYEPAHNRKLVGTGSGN